MYDELRDCVMLIDFGLSKMLKPDQKASEILGTAVYIAPEMWKGQEYDVKVDLWSIGVIIYEMLTGYRMFIASSEIE